MDRTALGTENRDYGPNRRLGRQDSQAGTEQATGKQAGRQAGRRQAGYMLGRYINFSGGVLPFTTRGLLNQKDRTFTPTRLVTPQGGRRI